MHRSQLRAAYLILSLASGLTGCYTWQPGALPTGVAETRATNPRPARVTFVNGSTIKLSGVRASGDSLVGESGEPPQRFAMLRADVRSVDERRLHVVRTVAAASGLVFTVLVAVVAIGFSGSTIGFAY